MKEIDKETIFQDFIIRIWGTFLFIGPAILALILCKFVFDNWLDSFEETFIKVLVSVAVYILCWIVIGFIWLILGFTLEDVINWYRKMKGQKPIGASIQDRRIGKMENKQALENNQQQLEQKPNEQNIMAQLHAQRIEIEMLSRKVNALRWFIIGIVILLIISMLLG